MKTKINLIIKTNIIMSFISENVIPGKIGKTFETNAKKMESLEAIKKGLLELKGVEDVELCPDSFPKEFIVHTNHLVNVKDIEQKVISIGYHAVPKGVFE